MPATAMTRRFSSANGSPVSMRHVNRITVAVLLEGPSGQKYEHAGMQVLVGNTRHSVLSTTMLCDKGWKFEQSQEEGPSRGALALAWDHPAHLWGVAVDTS